MFARRKDIVFERFDDRVLVFDLKKYLPWELNSTAAVVFLRTDGRTPVEDIAGGISREYDVDPDRVLQDILALYEDLHAKGLVTRRGG